MQKLLISLVVTLTLSAWSLEGRSTEPLVSVYRHVGALQCGKAGTPLSTFIRELSDAGIPVLDLSCGADGNMYPAACGYPNGSIGIFAVPESKVSAAGNLGFAPLSRLPYASKMMCQPVPRVRMYKNVGAVQCETAGTPLSTLTRQLSDAGISVFETSCGSDGKMYPDVCGGANGRIGIIAVPEAQVSAAEALGFAPLSRLPDAVETGCQPESRVSVYKYVGSVQCAGGGTSLSTMTRQLIDAGIWVHDASCGADGKMYPAVCGAADGRIGIFAVSEAKVSAARDLGFAPLSSVLEASKTVCPKAPISAVPEAKVSAPSAPGFAPVGSVPEASNAVSSKAPSTRKRRGLRSSFSPYFRK